MDRIQEIIRLQAAAKDYDAGSPADQARASARLWEAARLISEELANDCGRSQCGGSADELGKLIGTFNRGRFGGIDAPWHAIAMQRCWDRNRPLKPWERNPNICAGEPNRPNEPLDSLPFMGVYDEICRRIVQGIEPAGDWWGGNG